MKKARTATLGLCALAQALCTAPNGAAEPQAPDLVGLQAVDPGPYSLYAGEEYQYPTFRHYPHSDRREVAFGGPAGFGTLENTVCSVSAPYRVVCAGPSMTEETGEECRVRLTLADDGAAVADAQDCAPPKTISTSLRMLGAQQRLTVSKIPDPQGLVPEPEQHAFAANAVTCGADNGWVSCQTAKGHGFLLSPEEYKVW